MLINVSQALLACMYRGDQLFDKRKYDAEYFIPFPGDYVDMGWSGQGTVISVNMNDFTCLVMTSKPDIEITSTKIVVATKKLRAKWSAIAVPDFSDLLSVDDD